MKVYYDLHIHSVLSSCADVLNTPNNILNMCMLKELEMISVTDHNSGKQYESIDLLKDSYDFLVVHGMEVTVKEGFHVLAYFDSYEKLLELDKLIDSTLDKSVVTQREMTLGVDIFQTVTDEFDETKYTIDYLVNQKSISFLKLIKVVKMLDGLVIPAHINRKGTGILDFISDFSEYDIDGVEIYNKESYDELLIKYPYLKKYKCIYNSDAHDIDVISERENYLELDDLSFESFKKYFKEV